MRKFLISLLAAMLFAGNAAAQIVPSVPYNLTNGSLADATQVMGNFNTILTDVNANAAKNGANNDITSLTGLTTPLAHSYGGTIVYTGGTSGGSANAQTLTTVSPFNFTRTTGDMVTMVAGATNTTAMTLDVNSTGAASVKVTTTSGLADPTAGAITSPGAYLFEWDGTEYVLLNPTVAPASSITNAQLANMPANTIKGNNTAGSATPLDLTATQTTAMLNAMVGDSGSGGTKGLVPAPASGDAAALKFLKADGTWAKTGSIDYQTFTSSGTWTKPTGFGATSMALIQTWGAGGGGGNTNGQAAGNGGNGGSSSFGTWITAYGGTGATGGAGASDPGGSGGGIASTAANGQCNDIFEGTGAGLNSTTTGALVTTSGGIVATYKNKHGYFTGGGGGSASINGGNSVWGGGGGAGTTSSSGGTSQFGGNGGGAGMAGTAPGGGGGGSTTNGNASGGGGGSYKSRIIPLSSLGSTETVTVGAGGTAGGGATSAAGARGEVRVTVFNGN